MADATSNGIGYRISTHVFFHEMHNASVFDKEEKLSLTKVVKILKEAHSAIFTICFNCKVDEKSVRDRLKNLSEKDFKT